MSAGVATKHGATKGAQSPLSSPTAKTRPRAHIRQNSEHCSAESGASSSPGVSPPPRKRLYTNRNRRNSSPSGSDRSRSPAPPPRRVANNAHRPNAASSNLEDRSPAKRTRTGGGHQERPALRSPPTAPVSRRGECTLTRGESPRRRQPLSRAYGDGHRNRGGAYRSPSRDGIGSRKGARPYDSKDGRRPMQGARTGSHPNASRGAEKDLHSDITRVHPQRQHISGEQSWNSTQHSAHRHDHNSRHDNQPLSSTAGPQYSNRSLAGHAQMDAELGARRALAPQRKPGVQSGMQFGGGPMRGVGRGRGRQPPTVAKTGERGKSVNRVETCPFLLRVFCRVNDHHDVSEFSIDGGVPVSSELQIYTWMDATLREVADLIKDVSPEARDRRATLDFKVVQPDRSGNHVMIDLGSVHSTRTDAQDKTMLLHTQYRIGDYLDLAILLPRRTNKSNFRADGTAGTAGTENHDRVEQQLDTEDNEHVDAEFGNINEDMQNEHEHTTAAAGGGHYDGGDATTTTRTADGDVVETHGQRSPLRPSADEETIYRRDGSVDSERRVGGTGNTTDDKHERPRSSRRVLITDTSVEGTSASPAASRRNSDAKSVSKSDVVVGGGDEGKRSAAADVVVDGDVGKDVGAGDDKETACVDDSTSSLDGPRHKEELKIDDSSAHAQPAKRQKKTASVKTDSKPRSAKLDEPGAA